MTVVVGLDSINIDGTSLIDNTSITLGGTSVFAAGTINPALLPTSSVSYNGRKNRVINGTFLFDQRHEGANLVVNTSNGSYPADRFAVFASNIHVLSCGYNLPNTSGPLSTNNYIGVKVINTHATLLANDFFDVQTAIEGPNFIDAQWGTANPNPFTLSFQVYSTMTGNFTVMVSSNTNASSQYQAYPVLYNIPTANTWTNVSVTFAGANATTGNSTLFSTGAGNGCVWLTWCLGAGTNNILTANTWTLTSVGIAATGQANLMSVNNSVWAIQNVQFEPGSTQTAMEFNTYKNELEECQRYFEKSLNRGIAPGANVVANLAIGGAAVLFGVQGVSLSQFTYPYKVEKAVVPTLVTYDQNGNAASVSLFPADDGSVSSIPQSTVNFFTYMSGFTFDNENGAELAFDFTSNAEIII